MEGRSKASFWAVKLWSVAPQTTFWNSPADPPDPTDVVAGPAALTPLSHARRGPGLRELNKLPQNRSLKGAIKYPPSLLGLISPPQYPDILENPDPGETGYIEPALRR